MLEIGQTYFGEKGPNRRIDSMTPSRTRRTYRVNYTRIKADGSDGAKGSCYEDAFETWKKGEVKS